MPPQIADSDGTDLAAWLASIPSFAANWPRGILSDAVREHLAPAYPADLPFFHVQDNTDDR